MTRKASSSCPVAVVCCSALSAAPVAISLASRLRAPHSRSQRDLRSCPGTEQLVGAVELSSVTAISRSSPSLKSRSEMDAGLYVSCWLFNQWQGRHTSDFRPPTKYDARRLPTTQKAFALRLSGPKLLASAMSIFCLSQLSPITDQISGILTVNLPVVTCSDLKFRIISSPR